MSLPRNRYFARIIFLVVVLFWVTACSDSPENETTAPEPPANEQLATTAGVLTVELTLSVQVGPDGVVLSGLTNLPSGAEIMLGVASEAYVNSDPNKPNYDDYFAQAKTKVDDGTFAGERFSDRGNPLAPGRYRASAVMPIPQVQPANVKAVIGDRGQYLTGPLVKQGEMGVTVEVEDWFTVS